ncbi:hypothetical protein GCM10010424_38000 [Streptomyces lienomycini]
MLTFTVALKDKGVPVPHIAKKLTIKVGKNAGKSPSVASLYRALAEAEEAAAHDGLSLRPKPVRIRRPEDPLAPEEINLRERLQAQPPPQRRATAQGQGDDASAGVVPLARLRRQRWARTGSRKSHLGEQLELDPPARSSTDSGISSAALRARRLSSCTLIMTAVLGAASIELVDGPGRAPSPGSGPTWVPYFPWATSALQARGLAGCLRAEVQVRGSGPAPRRKRSTTSWARRSADA